MRKLEIPGYLENYKDDLNVLWQDDRPHLGPLFDTRFYNLWYNGQKEIHIMVNPKELQNFIRIVSREGWLTELLIPNVQALIDAGNKQP
ncbi:uncharacterized protein LOC117565893 isoform X3 [Drosophila albomicans]|uniref:Uncharacterized protein LOC117565893 isoform X3 n=1 Tax=Drosophila albomicans TaxID=7291 RepID=A0A9C6WGU2_DROAB|nr:uncharacterized protein LOC117565893 isoform X3 [Drosophila albomicans]